MDISQRELIPLVRDCKFLKNEDKIKIIAVLMASFMGVSESHIKKLYLSQIKSSLPPSWEDEEKTKGGLN